MDLNIDQLRQAVAFGIPFVVLDTETTGLNPGGIVEIAAQKFRGANVVSEFHAFVNPGCQIEQGAAFIHGITNEIIQEKGRKVDEVIMEFLNFCGSSTLIGHNIEFDLKFINHHLNQLNLGILKNPYVDTLSLVRRNFSLGTQDNQLTTLASHFGISMEGAHRAMKDVDLTRQIFLKILGV
jgi:DNA polymerase III epsilon subunit family exonuclease